MSELNLTTYVDALRPALMEHSDQQDAAIFLLNSVSTEKLGKKAEKGKEYILPDGSPVKRVLRGGLPVPLKFRLDSAKPKVAEGAYEYFKKEVVKDIHPQLKDEATERLLKIIHEDTTIPETKKENLLALSQGDDYARFLSETFIYAMNRPAKPDTGEGIQKISIPLLVFLFLFGVAIYGMTMYTLIKMDDMSQALMAFAFFFAVALFLFLIGFYFFLWRRDI